MLEVFGESDPAQYADEVEERWGDTDAYRRSQVRTARYGKDDWVRIKAGQEAIGARIASVMRAGAVPDSVEAMDAVEEHRQFIDRHFYLADPRFTEYYERIQPGPARFVHDAILANPVRQA